jgi:hypothetical protein
MTTLTDEQRVALTWAISEARRKSIMGIAADLESLLAHPDHSCDGGEKLDMSLEARLADAEADVARLHAEKMALWAQVHGYAPVPQDGDERARFEAWYDKEMAHVIPKVREYYKNGYKRAWQAALASNKAAAKESTVEFIDVVFAESVGTPNLTFVEVESPPGVGISFGEWVKRGDGYLVLRFNKVAAVAVGEPKFPWRSSANKPESIGPHHPVQVLAVIDDPLHRINGDDPFVDIAAYWPALDKWTITSQCRADTEVTDTPVNVAFWMPLPEAPAKREMFLLATHPAPIASAEEAVPVLDKPAKVGGTRFGKGVKWSTVIGAAQRHYEYEVTPEKEAARIARAKVVIESIQHGDYSALSAETAPFGYLHKFANPTRPHDPIERFSKYRFQKPNELAEKVIECTPLYTHLRSADIPKGRTMNADKFLSEAEKAAKLIDVMHKARYAMVIVDGRTVRIEGTESRLDFKDEIDLIDEAMTALGIDMTQPLPAPVDWRNEDES